MKKKFILFIVLFFFVSCSNKSPNAYNHNPIEVVKGEKGDFPQFNNQDVFIQATGIKISNFDSTLKILDLQSAHMYMCAGEKYFVTGSTYCLYFDKILLNKPIQTDHGSKVLGLRADHAYADKIFSTMLLHNVTFSIQGEDIILSSSTIHWDQKENILDSSINSKHTMRTKNGDILEGTHLLLDYRSEFFTMDNANVTLQDNL